MKHLAIAAVVFAVLLGSSAQAHITLVNPAPRPGAVSPIGSPCGYNPDPGRTTSQLLLPGSTVVVQWTEWINHPGHFRISFDNDGQDAFIDPLAYDDYYTNAAVLLDNIQDIAGVMQHSATIVLPDIECNNCTLQLLQVLTDKPPYMTGPNSDDLHRLCADLTLSLDAEFLFDDGFEDPAAPGAAAR